MSRSNCEYCGRNRTDQTTECAGCGSPFKDKPISEKGFCGRCGCEKSLKVKSKKWLDGEWIFYDPISGKRFTEFSCPNSKCFHSPNHKHEFKIKTPESWFSDVMYHPCSCGAKRYAYTDHIFAPKD